MNFQGYSNEYFSLWILRRENRQEKFVVFRKLGELATERETSTNNLKKGLIRKSRCFRLVLHD